VHEPRLTAARVARLATLDPDGRAHLVPIVFALDGDTLYSAVDRKPKRSRRLRRIENARARAEVTILVDYYEEDWAASGGSAYAAAPASSTPARNSNARSRCSTRSTPSTATTRPPAPCSPWT
jgi:PPOX class probable F420-dependent enzyme